MRIARAATILAAIAGLALSMRADASADAPIEVMIVGTIHMANPGTSLLKVPDVLGETLSFRVVCPSATYFDRLVACWRIRRALRVD